MFNLPLIQNGGPSLKCFRRLCRTEYLGQVTFGGAYAPRDAESMVDDQSIVYYQPSHISCHTTPGISDIGWRKEPKKILRPSGIDRKGARCKVVESGQPARGDGLQSGSTFPTPHASHVLWHKSRNDNLSSLKYLLVITSNVTTRV